MTGAAADSPGSGGAWRGSLAAVALCALYVLLLAYPAHLRVVGTYWTETDFYAAYAPDADRIAAGRFPENTYNPPGYPALLALLHHATGDHFTSGKWLSLAAASLTGLLAFHLYRTLFGSVPALLGVSMLLLSGQFTKFSIQATTDLLFVLLCVATMLVLVDDRLGTWPRVALAGGLSGLAYLTRYNGLFLGVPCLVALACHERRLSRRLAASTAYLACVLMITSPWLWLTYTHHGSPIYSTNYVDIARAIHGTSRGFTSLADVVLRDPLHFLSGLARSVVLVSWKTVGATLAVLPVGPLAVGGIVLSLFCRRRRSVAIFLLSACAYILVMALMHWEARYYFYVLVCYAGLAAYAIVEGAAWVGRKLDLPAAGRWSIVAAVAVPILVLSSARAYRLTTRAVTSQPYEVAGASAFLARATPEDATIVAHKPHVAYLGHRRWQKFPGANSLPELRAALPKRQPLYLVYDRMGRRFSRQFEALADPGNGVPWLTPVYADAPQSLVIYAVGPDDAGMPASRNP